MKAGLKQFAQKAYGLVILLGCIAALVYAEAPATTKPSPAEIIRSAAAEGKLAYRLTTPEEVKVLLGQPARQEEQDEGCLLVLEYPSVEVKFHRPSKAFSGPFTLRWVIIAGSGDVDIGRERQIVLRNEDDLKKLDTWGGFWNAPGGVSLVNLDLRGHGKLLEEMRFDSRTKWPEPNKMPEGFDPVRLLEEGKNPGLGIRGLHKQGIDGRGVGIAILDQRLLKNHVEYADRIARYEEVNVPDGMPLQMHGPPIVSIAVGKTCGVAPQAAVFYYAMPTTEMPDSNIYCDIIDKIIQHNENASPSEQIRVISISTTIMSDFARLQETLRKADQQGILLVSGDLSFGTLDRIPNKDPDDPSGYRRGKIYRPHTVLLIPTNRTTASHYGSEVYTYWTHGGGSWAVPYLAGLTALAYQVNPKIEPKTIVKLWVETAVHTDAGPVVNPCGFIEAVKIVNSK